MKKTWLKVISVCMAILLVCGTCFPVLAVETDTPESTAYQETAQNKSAATDNIKSRLEKTLYNTADALINSLVKGINCIIPSPKSWQDKEDYVSENFYEGTETFLTEPAANAKWSLGYSSASILTDDVLDGKHYVAGGISLSRKLASEIVDDSRVRTIALNDGSGRGTVVFAVIDAYGLANNDVREIRSRLEAYAKANDIVSINISVLHQHSVVDTLGMNGDIFAALFINPIINLFGLNIDAKNGKNPDFMENLYQVTAQSVEDACANMKTGKMFYSETDVSKYIRDKRLPYALNTNMERIRFVPDDGSRETWLATSVIHCVGNGVQGTAITADYPYYMEQYVKEHAGANFMLMLGAELSTSQNHTEETGCTEDMTRLESLAAFGTSLGKTLVDMQTQESVIEPLLNIRSKEVTFRVKNQIILLAAKGGLFTNTVVKNADGTHEVVSEIGYMELGTNLAVAMVPGELEASIAYGGALQGADAWSGGSWDYASLQKTVGTDRKLLVFGLMNDQMGYIVPDNDYMAMLAPQSKSVEFVSLGNTTASHYVTEFESLVASAKS